MAGGAAAPTVYGGGFVEYEGGTQSFSVQVSNLTHGYDSGDVITIDVEFTVVGDIG
jgi:hypothetical protein